MPPMSRSKLCLLSSSTLHLDENSSQQLLMADKTPTHMPRPQEERSHDNTTTPSSFQGDLLSHFERRLSDLGPRSKYPYLQQLDQHVTDAPKSLGAANSTSQSAEVLSGMRVREEKGRGTWWHHYTNSKATNQSSTGHHQ